MCSLLFLNGLVGGADFLSRHVTVTRHVDDPRGGARVLKPPPLLFIRHQPIVFSNLTALFLNSLEAGCQSAPHFLDYSGLFGLLAPVHHAGNLEVEKLV